MKNKEFIKFYEKNKGKEVEATIFAHNHLTNRSFSMPKLKGKLEASIGGAFSFIKIGGIHSITKEGKLSNRGSISLRSTDIHSIKVVK